MASLVKMRHDPRQAGALTCWLGEHTAREGRRILQDAGVASFETPADAATAVSYLSDWSRAQKALMRVPSSRSEDVAGDSECRACNLPPGCERRAGAC